MLYKEDALDKITLNVIRRCDSDYGFNSIALSAVYMRKCPLCGHNHLRDVFTRDGKGNSRSRIQCPHCLARTLDISVRVDSSTQDHLRRGWFWPTDDDGYPVFGDGERVDIAKI